MRTLPPEPSPGDKISASLIREIIRALRERTIIPGTGVNTSVGPNGTVVSANATRTNVNEYVDNGCFKILSIDEDDENDGNYTISFGNTYYMIGGKTYALPVDEDEEDDEEPEPPSIEVTFPCIIYLSLKAVDSSDDSDDSDDSEISIYYCQDISSLQGEQDNDEFYCIPLYEFDSDGVLKCDFRNIPKSSMGEF